ncbi:MAG: TRAP transporter substrate-binding protein DctP [Hyphomicrobiaceae bacterium]
MSDNSLAKKTAKLGRRKVLTGTLVGAGATTVSTLAMPSIARAEKKISWRIQTHQGFGTPAGATFKRFLENVKAMSAGRLTLEPFSSSSLVKTTEAMNATRSGILDADMSWPGYGVGVDPALQFFADLNGGYMIPEQPQYWLEHGGGRALADEIFHAHNLHLVGFWLTLPESLVSKQPIPDFASLKGFRVRSPLGLQGEVLAAAGAEPVVLDFGEIFTAIDTGIVDGADASEIRVNDSLGLHKVAKHATYPGFHAMPFVHLAVNKARWDALPADLQKIVEISLKKAAYERATEDRILNTLLVEDLKAKGVFVHTWEQSEIDKFRKAARPVWESYSNRSPAAKKVYASHMKFMKKIGIIS